MKFLLFSIFFLTTLYGIATLILVRYKKPYYDNGVLSVDVGNTCKGFAIVLVLLSHIGNRFGTNWLTPLGSWGVGIFLFFSGYGLASSVKRKGLKGYWKKRIIAAYLPYIIAELIGFLLCLGAEYQDITLIKILKDMLLIDTVHPFGWYMQCLFLNYFMFFLGRKLFPENRRHFCVFLLVFSGAIFITFRSLFKQQMFSFILGVWMADHISWFERTAGNIWKGILLLSMGGLCLLLRQFPNVRELHWTMYHLIFAMQVMLLTLGSVLFFQHICSNCNAVLTDAFLRTGLISTELYLYHAFIFIYISKFHVSYRIIAFYFVASLTVALLLYYIKTKVNNFCTYNTLMERP